MSYSLTDNNTTSVETATSQDNLSVLFASQQGRQQQTTSTNDGSIEETATTNPAEHQLKYGPLFPFGIDDVKLSENEINHRKRVAEMS